MKILCVGNPKTGTTSLLQAMNILDLPSVGYSPEYIDEWYEEDYSNLMKQVDRYAFLKDWPWAHLYRQIFDAHPDVKFILTTRNEQEWVASYIFACSNFPAFNKYRQKLYGFDVSAHLSDPDFLIENIYRRKNVEMQEFAEQNSIPLLSLDIDEKDKWTKITSFLRIDTVPNEPYPFENRTNR